MRYLGGKSRISKDIAEIINKHLNENTPFVSLFCGTCAIESKIKSKNKICNDLHKYLIDMWTGLQSGYVLPDYISREKYYRIKSAQDTDTVLSGFVGFGCSFGGKWWGGYAQNKTNTNYCAQSKRSVLKDLDGLSLETTKFTYGDYKDVIIPQSAVVYCDPPYVKTTAYTNSNQFNTNDFWEYVRNISNTNLVFVSEQNAPKDFICVWSKPFKRMLDKDKSNIFEVEEKLFIHESQLLNFYLGEKE